MEEVFFTPDQLIFKENTLDDSAMYLILEGHIETCHLYDTNNLIN